jgi:hypothetical protein
MTISSRDLLIGLGRFQVYSAAIPYRNIETIGGLCLFPDFVYYSDNAQIVHIKRCESSLAS